MITFTEDHDGVCEMVADFAGNELAPKAESIDEHGTFPSDLIEQVAELGLLGVTVPEEFGGGGGDLRMALLVAEQLASGCAAVAQVVWQHSWAAMAIAKYAPDDVRKSLLPALATGERLATVAHVEATSTGILSSLTTLASSDGALTGEKPWVVAGEQATVRVVTATDPDGKQAMYLSCSDDGWTAEGTDTFLGLRGSGVASARLDGAPSTRLGDTAAMDEQLAVGRLGLVAMMVGTARAAHEYSIKYASERAAFGRTIDRFQALQLKMAESIAGIEAARLLMYRSAQLHDDGQSFGKEASMARFLGADRAYQAAKESVQILGGNGFSREYPVERMYRDVQTLTVGDGSNDTHRLHLAEHLVGVRA